MIRFLIRSKTKNTIKRLKQVLDALNLHDHCISYVTIIMEEKIARINWKRGQYSDVFRSSIIDPSPLKEGQKVKVLWGTKTDKHVANVA